MTPTSKQAQIQEILKCGKNPIHFMNQYCKIQHPKQGLIPFKTYTFQDDCVNDFVNNRFNIVLKSRQLGLSTVTAAYAVWLALFYKEKNILVIATKLKTAINFIKKVKTILTSLPPWLKITSFEDTRQEIRFKNGSYIQAIPTSEDAGRSEALSLLIVDEAAFIRNFEEIWTGLRPTLATGGSAIILSTPNGVGGQYYQLWVEAESKINNFNAIKLKWDVHPEHDKAWFTNECKGFPKRKVAQEMLCEFIGSGDTFINADDIAELEANKRDPIGRGEGFERDVWFWANPVVGHKYIMSADVARGDAADFSTFHILDTTTADIVAEFMGKIAPEKFGTLLDKYGRKYNNALLCPEHNNFGHATCTRLKDLKYPKLVYQKAKPSMMENYMPEDDELVGFSTQTKSREMALTKLEELIRNKVVRCYSVRFIAELRTFVWNGSKAQAIKNEHDDLVMSMAINCWLFDAIYGRATGGDSSSALSMIKAISKTSTSLATVPGAGNEVRPVMRPGMMAASIHRPQVQSPSVPFVDDFRWLIN